MSLLDDVAIDVDSALKTIEGLEIYKTKVYLLTRTWLARKGRGNPVDVITKIDPNPYISDYSHSQRIREGGSIKQGDLIIKYLPFNIFPLESDVNNKTGSDLIEKYYVLDNELYEVISIVKGYAYWNVQIRKTNKNKVVV